MAFEVVGPWVGLALKGLVIAAGVTVLFWIGWVWREMQILGFGGVFLGVLAVAACVGVAWTINTGGMPGHLTGDFAELRDQLKGQQESRAQLEQRLDRETDQLAELEAKVRELGTGSTGFAGGSTLFVTGADPRSIKTGWFLNYVSEGGDQDQTSFEFVRTRKADAPLSAIRGAVGPEMWKRIKDGTVKAVRGVMLEAKPAAN